MSKVAAVAVLALAAVLEAGGDAMIRSGLHSGSGLSRALWLAVGGLVLFGYGVTVNTPPWDFGSLLGLYVVFFFVIAQLVSWIVFHQPPSTAVLAGGALIVAGGVVISIAQG